MTIALVATVVAALPVGTLVPMAHPGSTRPAVAPVAQATSFAQPRAAAPPAVRPSRSWTHGTDASPASHQPGLLKTSLFVFIIPPPPPPQDWTPTHAEVDAAVEAKTGVAAPGLPDDSYICVDENYGTSTGGTPPAEDFITPLRPEGSILAFVAQPITNGLFVQYYACWPRT